MRLPEFEALLKRTIGLDAGTIGTSSVPRAVAVRMSACGLEDLDQYRACLADSPAELQRLVEAIVVPETWFFRDREAFAALAAFARDRRPQSQPLRLLSIPCSTGEEPYSIAMALLDAGLSPEQFRIDAVDVSTRALDHAGRAIYGRNSFRGTDFGFRERYFTPAGAGYELLGTVRDCVRFQHGNLFDEGLLASRGPYQAVFCRNLLIYFDAAGKDRAVAILDRLLDPDGILFVGPSESSLLLDHQFQSARVPLAFGFRKKGTGTAPKPSRAPAPAKLPKAPPAPPFAAVLPRDVTAPSPPVAEPVGIEGIRRLADEGRLAEAAALCEGRLKEGGASPEVLLILGLVRDAMGEGPRAAECYRKALFLDPNHAQALVHLALFHQKQGNAADARILGERLRRLEQRKAR